MRPALEIERKRNGERDKGRKDTWKNNGLWTLDLPVPISPPPPPAGGNGPCEAVCEKKTLVWPECLWTQNLIVFRPVLHASYVEVLIREETKVRLTIKAGSASEKHSGQRAWWTQQVTSQENWGRGSKSPREGRSTNHFTRGGVRGEENDWGQKSLKLPIWSTCQNTPVSIYHQHTMQLHACVYPLPWPSEFFLEPYMVDLNKRTPADPHMCVSPRLVWAPKRVHCGVTRVG